MSDVCLTCGLGAYVIDDLIGHACRFCGTSWPYERPIVRMDEQAETA